MSVHQFEAGIGRRSDDARRYHNFKLSGGMRLRIHDFAADKNKPPIKPLTESEQGLIRKVVAIFQNTECRNSAFLDLRPYKRAVLKAAQPVAKLSIRQQQTLFRKLSTTRHANLDTVTDIINQLLLLAQSDSLDFEKSRTFKRIDCLKTKGYKRIKYLGNGAFGEVSLFEKGGKTYAVKRISVQNQIEVDEVKGEIEIMKLIKGTGIGPDLHDYFLCKSTKHGNNVFLVMDYMNMGQISDHPKLMEKAKYQKQLASKLKRLHAMGIKHNDLVYNDGNALFHKHPDGRIEVFIGDFGLAETTKMWLKEETFGQSGGHNQMGFRVGKILGAICANEGLVVM